jgi:hypothetical protein
VDWSLQLEDSVSWAWMCLKKIFQSLNTGVHNDILQWLWDFRCSKQWLWTASGMWHYVVSYMGTNISADHIYQTRKCNISTTSDIIFIPP